MLDVDYAIPFISFCQKLITHWSKGWVNTIPGGYSIYPWVGRCGLAPHTLTLFKTKIADFPTLFKTFNPKPYPV